MVKSLIPEQRSKIMRAIASRDTRPEMLVRRALHAAGFRFRLHVKELPGKPDLVFPKYMAALEVRGCFWHSHCCPVGHTPKTNKTYWVPKLTRNRERDERNEQLLTQRGYRVKAVWECQVSTDERLANTICDIAAWLEAG